MRSARPPPQGGTQGGPPRLCQPREARLAYDEGELELHVPILVRMSATVNGGGAP